MAHRKLYAYRLTVYEPSSATNTSRVPVDGATITPQKRGAIAQGEGNDNDGAGATITVHNINSIAAGDTIYINDGTVQRTVASVTATTIVTSAGGTGTFEWTDGAHIWGGSAPTVYTDGEGAEASAGLTTDSNGEVEWYAHESIMDCLVVNASDRTMLKDLAGGDGQNFVRPEEWGAKGDGSTNDSAAFADMLEYLAALAEPAVVMLGAATYRLGSVLLIQGLSGIRFQGQGLGITKIEINHTGVGINLNSTNTDITLQDLTIERLSGTSDAVQADSTTTRLTLENVLFQGGGTGVDDNGTTDLRMRNCYFTGSGTWVDGVAFNASVRPHITGLVFRPEGNWTRGIDVDTGVVNARFTNIDISPVGSVSGTGIQLRDSGGGTDPRDVIVTASHIDAGASGIGVDVDAGQGCEFNGVSVEGSSVGYDIDGGTGLRLDGGEIVDIGDDGVQIDGGTFTSIMGTQISDMTNFGIDIAGTVSQVYITGVIFGNHLRGGATAYTGIRIAAGAGDDIVVLGCSSDGTLGSVVSNSKDIEASSSVHIAHNPEGLTRAPHHNPWSFLYPLLLTSADTTPDVANVSTLYTSPGSTLTIAGLENPQVGQRLTVYNSGAFAVTLTDSHGSLVANSANITNGGGGDVILGQADIAILEAVPGGSGGIPSVYWAVVKNINN